MNWNTNELIFYIGLIISILAIVAIISTIIVLKIKKIKLDAVLDKEYGEEYQKNDKK